MITTKNDPELKAKLNKLAKIENSLRLTQKSDLSPRAGLAFVVGMAAWCLVYGGAIAMEVKGLAPFCSGLIVGILATGVTYKLSKLPRSYVERLDCQLAKYEPECPSALLQLQNEVRITGTYDFDLVRHWLTQERYAVQRAMSPQDEGTSQFLKRRL